MLSILGVGSTPIGAYCVGKVLLQNWNLFLRSKVEIPYLASFLRIRSNATG